MDIEITDTPCISRVIMLEPFANGRTPARFLEQMLAFKSDPEEVALPNWAQFGRVEIVLLMEVKCDGFTASGGLECNLPDNGLYIFNNAYLMRRDEAAKHAVSSGFISDPSANYDLEHAEAHEVFVLQRNPNSGICHVQSAGSYAKIAVSRDKKLIREPEGDSPEGKHVYVNWKYTYSSEDGQHTGQSYFLTMEDGKMVARNTEVKRNVGKDMREHAWIEFDPRYFNVEHPLIACNYYGGPRDTRRLAEEFSFQLEGEDETAILPSKLIAGDCSCPAYTNIFQLRISNGINYYAERCENFDLRTAQEAWNNRMGKFRVPTEHPIAMERQRYPMIVEHEGLRYAIMWINLGLALVPISL